MDLFGKKKLEDRVTELEAELIEAKEEQKELLRTLDKRDEKIKRLTSANQEANVALKAALQKSEAFDVAAQAQAGPGYEMREDYKPEGIIIGPREFEKLARRLSVIRSPEDDLLTAYVGNQGTLNSGLPSDAEKIIGTLRSVRGFAVLQCPTLFTLILKPPFPLAESTISIGGVFQIDPLKEMMEMPVLVISAHAGDTFLGAALGKEGFDEEEFVQSQVKEKHSKGGWSQKRFERLREEDIKNHIDEVIERLAKLKGKYGSVVRFAVVGGDPALLKQIMPSVGLPVVQRRLERHDEKRLDKLRDEIYGFTCYRI